MQNCSFTGSSVAGNNYTGGVVGSFATGTVQGCYATGAVIGAAYIGGVAGRNSGGTMQSCYATADVSSSLTGTSVSYSGGLVGEINGAAANVQNCYATGDITGAVRTGGLTGNLGNGSIQNCYALGVVEGTNYAGGVIGYRLGGTLQNTVALNPDITMTTSTVNIGRVSGFGTTGLSGNYARSGMTFTIAGVTSTAPSGTAANKDGADVASGTGGYNGQDFGKRPWAGISLRAQASGSGVQQSSFLFCGGWQGSKKKAVNELCE
jgi:hypothetical protein